MIFADSLPLAKSFFAAADLPVSTVGLLSRFVVACLSTLRSAAQAADAIRIDPRHRGQLVRFLARHGWAKDWATLERLAEVVLDACLHEQGDWLFLLDQTLHTTCGWHAQNTISCYNTKRNKKSETAKHKSKHTHKKSKANTQPPRRNHVFVFGLLISPQSGTRIPCVRPYYTEEYCQQRQAQAKPGKPAPTFATQADIAAQMIRSLRVPAGSRVLVLGDTAFEAKQIRAACQARGFDWNVGTVTVAFSTTKEPQTGQAVEVQKILLTNLLNWDAERVVAAYSVRWQIELFFKEMKSELGMDNYRVRDFREVEGWVRACCVAFCYLEYYRRKQMEESSSKEWWFRQRAKGLARQVLVDAEWADLEHLAGQMESAEGRQRLRERLRKAVPLEQRRPA